MQICKHFELFIEILVERENRVEAILETFDVITIFWRENLFYS